MKFWFHIHDSRPQARDYRKRAETYLSARGCATVHAPEEADFAVAIGGDGTIVACHRLTNRPIIGVNAGTLGYLPKIEPENLEMYLQRILDGDYTLENRMTLSACVKGERPVNALNDAAIVKPDASVIRFTVNVDGVSLMRYTADGIIAATPTGSTGYSLSAGGPIVDPVSRSVILTPVAPHTLVNRPIVLSEDSRITIFSENKCILSVDGDCRPLPEGCEIEIKKSPDTVQFVSFGRESFIERLRKKLS